jgi:protocatechuate 3,4-dioxygenase beta subunit
MTPQSVITGKVTDEDGDPVMRASVQVIRERWVNGRRQQMPLSSDSTDDRGEYRIAGLMPGKYFLQVSASRPIMMHEAGQMRPAEGPGDQTYIPLFYPGVTELGQAQALSLAPGQEARGVDLSLRKANTWRIRGQVLDDAGKPMQYAGVMAHAGRSFDGDGSRR